MDGDDAESDTDGGGSVVTIAQKKPDGSLATNRVTAEKDGVKPPM
jgi:hypothetical protein